jgi:hypothetical protein
MSAHPFFLVSRRFSTRWEPGFHDTLERAKTRRRFPDRLVDRLAILF